MILPRSVRCMMPLIVPASGAVNVSSAVPSAGPIATLPRHVPVSHANDATVGTGAPAASAANAAPGRDAIATTKHRTIYTRLMRGSLTEIPMQHTPAAPVLIGHRTGLS